MPAITEREIEASYDLAEQVYEQQLNFNDAVAELVDNYQMKESSANMSITLFQRMMHEKECLNTLSIAHIRYYLEKVWQNYGEEGLKKILRGLEIHIDYRESSGVNMPGARKLHQEFSSKIGLKSNM